MRMRQILALILCLASPAAAEQDHATRMAASRELFTGEVRRVLVEHCVKCHGGEKTRSEFDLATRAGLLAGGDQGVAVVVGNAKQSPMMDYLRHREEPYMPPKKPQLPENALAAIEKWIDLGAAYDQPLVEGASKDSGPMQVTDADREFWSFAPLATDFGGKAKIDDFIESGERASDPVLARRLHFDLTGLPPVFEENLDFLVPDSADNYDLMVDRLLASPRFGEKWARHWLDVARFAESHGFEHDYDRNHAFHYRDFVIRAFNDDLPYDQFVKWQLAGDEIAPDNPLAMMATGFLGAGVYPTQITSSEAERVRYDAMDDMLATTGSAMLATTIGCARCHDHKYDPIPERDYYSMLSAFTTTVRSDVELDFSALDPEANAKFAEKENALKAKLADYEAKKLPIAYRRWADAEKSKADPTPQPSWLVLKPTSLNAKGGAKFVTQPDGSHLATGANPSNDVYTFKTTAPLAKATALRLEVLADKSMARSGPGRAGNGNFQLTGVELTAAGQKIALKHPRATFEQNTDSLSIASSVDGDKSTGWAVDPQFGKDHAAIYEIAEPAKIAAGAELVVTLRFDGNGKHNIGRPRLSLSDVPAPGALGFDGGHDPRAEAEQAIAALLAKPAPDKAAILEQFKVLDPAYHAITNEIASHDAERAKHKQKVMVCSDGNKVKPMRHHTNSGKVPDFYNETYQLSRGDTKQKGEVAQLEFLQVLSRGSNKAPTANRTALADWITDTKHGAGHLLARVIVNRLWQHHFGQGIVGTPNDFGFQGERPTHPELLDWLATKLIDNGWHLKHIHRLIVTSDAYKAERAPRRLQAEAIRDSALAVGGQLDETMFGAGTLSESNKRRSIYFKVKRSQIPPVMQLFDWPDTLTSLGKRAITTTPSQALVFLNNPHMRALAEGFAKRIADVPDPVTTAYRIAYLRAPSKAELATANGFIVAQTTSHQNRAKALADFCGALMGANEFIYIE